MQTDAIDTPTLLTGFSADAADMASSRGQADFRRLLEVARAQAERSPEAGRAKRAAEEFVSMVFVEPILKQLRESNQAAPPFAPTNGEKQFRSMLDARFAHEITKAARFPLVDRLARDLRRSLETEAQHTPPVRV